MSDPKKRSTSIVVLIIITILIGVGALGYLFIVLSQKINNEINDIRQAQNEQFNRHIETNQFLLSTIDWSSRRANLMLFMRDQIAAEWKRIGLKNNLDEAFLIAESIVKECENYSYIEPFLILSMQCCESSFQKGVKSPMGALGLNQIMPPTGRLLAGYYNMEYTDSLLYNIPISTKFAIKLFDFSYAHYQQWDVSIADYNGGPYQAHYFKKDKSKLAAETKAYVPKVLNKKAEYDSSFSKFRINEDMGLKPVSIKNINGKKKG